MAEQVRSLARGLAILRALEENEDGLSLQDLHRITVMSKPAILRMLQTLEEEGYAYRRLIDGHWCFASSARPNRDTGSRELACEAAAAVLPRLCDQIGWPSDFALYREGRMEIVETTRGRSPFGIIHLPRGARVHLEPSAHGRAWLGFSDSEARVRAIDDLVHSADPFDRPVRDGVRLTRLIADVQSAGYGERLLSYAGPITLRRVANRVFAVPVRAGTDIVATVSIICDIHAVSPEQFRKALLPALTDASQEIGRHVTRYLS